MKRLLFIFTLFQTLLIIASCAKYDQQLEVTTLNSPQVLLLHKKPNQKYINSMVIHCYGKLDGEAKLILMLNGAPYKTESMKGKVDFTWRGDWYSDTMELRYQPSNVTGGQFVIDYAFSD